MNQPREAGQTRPAARATAGLVSQLREIATDAFNFGYCCQAVPYNREEEHENDGSMGIQERNLR